MGPVLEEAVKPGGVKPWQGQFRPSGLHEPWMGESGRPDAARHAHGSPRAALGCRCTSASGRTAPGPCSELRECPCCTKYSEGLLQSRTPGEFFQPCGCPICIEYANRKDPGSAFLFSEAVCEGPSGPCRASPSHPPPSPELLLLPPLTQTPNPTFSFAFVYNEVKLT